MKWIIMTIMSNEVQLGRSDDDIKRNAVQCSGVELSGLCI
jgi:hypothetical protein